MADGLVLSKTEKSLAVSDPVEFFFLNNGGDALAHTGGAQGPDRVIKSASPPAQESLV